MKKSIFILTLIVLSGLQPVRGEVAGERHAAANAVKIKEINITKTIDLTGKVLANRELVIQSPFDGTIEDVHVIDGEWVTKGSRILSFRQSDISKRIEQNLTEIKQWEKTLRQRENWKVREKSAEESAKRKISELRKELDRNRKSLKNPAVVTTGEGKILRIRARGDQVPAGGELAVIVDDYVMRVPVPEEYESYFFKGMRLEVDFSAVKLKRSGRVGFEDGKPVILVSNPDLKIQHGMNVSFSVTEKMKGVILIRESDFRRDQDGREFVFLITGNKGVKRYITASKFSNANYLVSSGLKAGDEIISPVPDTEETEFFLSSAAKKTMGSIDAPGKTAERKPAVKKESFSLGKKMEFVISGGISFIKPETLIMRNNGVDRSVSQYADMFDLTLTSGGTFKENLTGIPVNLTVNYKLSDGLFLKFGGEYAVMSNRSERNYSVAWPDIDEAMNYSIKNSISNIMPFVGIEKRFSSFGIYAVLGLNLTNFNHTTTLKISDGSSSLESVEEIKGSGVGVGVNIGAKYMMKLKEKFGIFFKAEFAVQSISSFTGDKTLTVNDPLGSSYTTTITGNIYQYDIDPYGEGSFGWWDIHNASPSGSAISNVSNFSLQLSRIRLLIGFSF